MNLTTSPERKRNKKTPEEIKEYHRLYYHNHIEKRRLQNKNYYNKYYPQHKEEIKNKVKEYQKNKKIIKETPKNNNKEISPNRKQQLKNAFKKWYNDNKTEFNNKMKSYYHKKKEDKENLNLLENLPIYLTAF